MCILPVFNIHDPAVNDFIGILLKHPARVMISSQKSETPEGFAADRGGLGVDKEWMKCSAPISSTPWLPFMIKKSH
jgi:hypothetical protein